MIFGAYMTNSIHANKEAKNILILGEGITQGFDNITLTAEKMYSINFIRTNTKFA